MTDTPKPIVLVHGAWQGPWCWDGVADRLRQAGHEVHAVELPGHDKPGTAPRNWNTVGSYLKALDQTVSALTEPPVLVGHSMGGYLVQRYLESDDAACGVLVASAPKRGVLAANLRTMRNHPTLALKATLTADYSALVASDELVREFFFTADTPDGLVSGTRAQLQNESWLAINTMNLRWPKPKRVSVPMHVIAAEHDAIFTVAEQRATAEAYGADLQVLSGMGHGLMLDTGWEQLADLLLEIAAT
jgi:pimeloyl-ACP methyl ester carboxylesterase